MLVLSSEYLPYVIAARNGGIFGAGVLDASAVEEVSCEHAGFLVIGEANFGHAAADVCSPASGILCTDA